jgi:hypothetical protein
MTDKDEINALKARVAELERAAKPPQPFRPEPHQRFDPTANMSMPRSALQAMVDAVPDSVLADIVSRGGVPPPSGAGASGQVTAVRGPSGVYPNTSGWREAVPLGPPPGVAACDRLMDEADRRDRVELVERIAQAQRVEDAARKLAAEYKP